MSSGRAILTENDSFDAVEGRTNRRLYPRYVVPEKPRAAFISGHLRVAGQVLSISLGGLLLCTKQPIATGTTGKGDVSVVLPSRRFHANAIVRHVDPRGRISLEFTKMSPEDRDALWAFCGTLRGTEVRKATPTDW
jgi:c-di-GMP-binding flagellar brake protein YcgR